MQVWTTLSAGLLVYLLAPSASALAQDAGVPDVPQEAAPDGGGAVEPDAPEEPATPAQVATSEPLEYGAVAVVPAARGGVRLEAVPRNVRRIGRADLEASTGLGVAGALDQRLGSVVRNDVQNNPMQPDLQYRGYTASPLLGSPQGLVLYQNGVRSNDAFGDVVQWDLVPEFAIDEIQVMPGANPLYGLNALGGVLRLQMKDGFRAPGNRIEAQAGSYGRYQTSAEHGRAWGDWAFYGGASLFGEQGFRDHSQSSRHALYADLRTRDARQEAGVNATWIGTDLNGNGPSPIELLERRRSAVFTYPDNTQNQMLMVSVDARRELAEDFTLAGTAYVKHLERDTRNGDEAEVEPCDDDATRFCTEDGEPLSTESGAPIAAVTPAYDGAFNTTGTVSDALGTLVHLDIERPLLGRPNRFVVGSAYDGSQVSFAQRVELGRLTADRSVAAENVFVGNDGFRTGLDVNSHHVGAFVSDQLSIVDRVWLELAGRFNYTRIELDDRLGTALNGTHAFNRFNPSVGATYTPIDPLTLFVSYSESSRAPSAVELACADPEEPCRVPNAFVADPPLEQVVARAIEVGARGRVGGTKLRPTLTWSLAGFGSRNQDDILFVAGARVGTGYFRNAGETQRLGLEAALELRTKHVRAFSSYALLRATFESSLTLPGEGNPKAREGDDDADVIDVSAGDRIPGIPLHSLKAGIVVSPTDAWDIGLSSMTQSSRPFRGDEANLLNDVDGYTVASAYTSYWLLKPLQIFVKADNVFGARYETFGVLAEPGDTVPGVSDSRFLSPGAPLWVMAGVVVRAE